MTPRAYALWRGKWLRLWLRVGNYEMAGGLRPTLLLPVNGNRDDRDDDPVTETWTGTDGQRWCRVSTPVGPVERPL